MNRDVFSKYKPNIKLATRFDSDGKEIQVEIREDTDQTEKLQEIIDILVAAGYFRARIKGLSAFDKVIGGMTWCIESCNFDIDVDLLFQENLTIGQKISLTEKLVSVLPLMECPHLIEPHQIQGLDFIHIFPLVQWLVRKSVEAREQRADRVRAFACSQFDKLFKLEISERDRRLVEKLDVRVVDDSDNPRRRYRLRGPRPQDELARVQVTLLEYGTRTSNIVLPSRLGNKNRNNEIGNEIVENENGNERDGDEEREQSELDVDVLADKMALDQNIIESEQDSVQYNSEDLQKLSEHYASLRAELVSDTRAHKLTHEQQLLVLTKLKESLTAQSERLSRDEHELKELVNEQRDVLRVKRDRRCERERDVVELMNEELDLDKKRALEQIQELVAKIESSRAQETKFKEKCKTELADLEKRISELQSQPQQNSLVEHEHELVQTLQSERDKLNSLRLRLAKKTRATSTLLRKLDQIPSRAELGQYQRRFMELYNQVSAKHRETKQFYTLYNTLDDTKLYLGKELSLLNSILDSYSQSMSSNHAREQFIKQFESIVEGIQATKRKVEARYNEERSKRDSLNEQLLMLVDQQRRYYVELRHLTRECQRNETLLNKFKSM